MTDQKQITTGNAGVPTQVANPKRASWRTLLQSLLAHAIAVNGILAILAGFLATNSHTAATLLGTYYGPAIAVINGIVLVGAFGAKLFAQLMADPTINAWVTKNLPQLAPIAPEQ
jgi:hypothetical protein